MRNVVTVYGKGAKSNLTAAMHNTKVAKVFGGSL
jgi:hypothetical protein